MESKSSAQTSISESGHIKPNLSNGKLKIQYARLRQAHPKADIRLFSVACGYPFFEHRLNVTPDPSEITTETIETVCLESIVKQWYRACKVWYADEDSRDNFYGWIFVDVSDKKSRKVLLEVRDDAYLKFILDREIGKMRDDLLLWRRGVCSKAREEYARLSSKAGLSPVESGLMYTSAKDCCLYSFLSTQTKGTLFLRTMYLNLMERKFAAGLPPRLTRDDAKYLWGNLNFDGYLPKGASLKLSLHQDSPDSPSPYIIFYAQGHPDCPRHPSKEGAEYLR